MSEITLYELPGCPYCAKVRTKLEELDLEHEIVEVPQSHDRRERVEEVSGQTGVPVISDESNGVQGMHESDEIIEYLEENYAEAA